MGWMGRISVRSTLLFMVVLTGCVVSVMAGIDFEASAQRYLLVKRIESFNTLADDCLVAGNAILFERGRAQIALHKAGVLSEVDRQFIDTHRQQGDGAIIRVLAQLALSPNPEIREQEPGLRAAWTKLQQARVLLERDFGLPPSLRDPALPRQWSLASNALAEFVERVVVSVSWMPEGDPEFDRLSSARLLLFQFRDNVGREAERLGKMRANRHGLSLSDSVEIHEWRGRVNQQWKQLEIDARRIGDPVFTLAVDGIRERYFAHLRPLNDYLLAHGRSPGEAALPVEGYSAMAVPAIASIAPAVDRLAQLSADLAEHRKQVTRSEFERNALIFAAVLALLVGLLLVIRWRLILPMRQVLTRIQRLSMRETGSAGALRGDEFVAVRQALDLLEETQRLRTEDARQLAESHRQMERLAVTDGLTGIYNRRHFNDALAREWARASRSGRELALIMVDIDFFKRYNDHYGHQAGDACLVAVAQALGEYARRAGDCLARYGGEEFVLLLPEMARAQAASVAESLCRSVADLALPHAQSEQGVVTLSVGVAVRIPRADSHPDDLLRWADEALYSAKHGGRNRVCCAPD